MVLYHADRFDPADRAGRDRDLAIALANVSRGVQGEFAARFGGMALPLLEAAVRARPDDVAAREALATILALQDRSAEALEAATAALAIEPGRERLLDLGMVVASRLRKHDIALDFGRRTLAIDPWMSRYHLSMAQVLSRDKDWRPGAGDWPAAIAACKAALRIDPTNLEARRLLIAGAVMNGDLALARAESRIYLAFDAPDADRVRRWLESNGASTPER